MTKCSLSVTALGCGRLNYSLFHCDKFERTILVCEHSRQKITRKRAAFLTARTLPLLTNLFTYL